MTASGLQPAPERVLVGIGMQYAGIIFELATEGGELGTRIFELNGNDAGDIAPDQLFLWMTFYGVTVNDQDLDIALVRHQIVHAGVTLTQQILFAHHLIVRANK